MSVLQDWSKQVPTSLSQDHKDMLEKIRKLGGAAPRHIITNRGFDRKAKRILRELVVKGFLVTKKWSGFYTLTNWDSGDYTI